MSAAPHATLAPQPQPATTRRGKPRAAAVVWRPRGGEPEFLVVSCAGNPARFTLPGGKIDPGETGPQAALRETREESGVHAFAQRTLGSYLHHKGRGKQHPTTVYLARYHAAAEPGEDRARRWLTAHELCSAGIRLRDDARDMIQRAAWHFRHHRAAA